MRKFVPEARLAEALKIYRPFWDVHMLEDVNPLPGAVELLRALHTGGSFAPCSATNTARPRAPPAIISSSRPT